MFARTAAAIQNQYLHGIVLAFVFVVSGCATQPMHTRIDRNAVAGSEIRNGLRGMLDEGATFESTADSQGEPADISSIFADNAVLLAEGGQEQIDLEDDAAQHTLAANENPMPELMGPVDTAPAMFPTGFAAAPERDIESFVLRAPEEVTQRVIEQTPEQRRAQLIEELASIFRQESRTSATPAESVTQLAALEVLEPGILTDSVMQSSSLTQREQEVLQAWRVMLRQVGEGTRSAAGDVSLIPRSIDAAHLELGSGSGLAIAQAMLCSKVDGFGRYTQLPDKLLAGRTHPAIVYIELENFASRAGTDGRGNSAHTVEIGQELSLYHDADGLLAWKRPEQIVTDTSRSERHDFFLVQRIDLPQTLTVGIYRLKVTVQDKVSGYAAEVILPLEVVADANLIRKFR